MIDILVDTLRISGFRGAEKLEVDLDYMTVLIGPNNSGKTTVLKALGLALGDYGRYISEEDFNIVTGAEGQEHISEQIIVDVRIIPIDDNNQRDKIFKEHWLAEFGDSIRADADGNQFIGIRTTVSRYIVKSGFQIERQMMQSWPSFQRWPSDVGKLDKISMKIECLPFLSIEPQRDIYSELRDKSSYIGKVLSGIKYDNSVIEKLENEIEEINKDAVAHSAVLDDLKTHLKKLNDTFFSHQGAGIVEITPFPKKVRDLSKHFSIHYGETSDQLFAIEYHGMGTRSWASMLAVHAFLDCLKDQYNAEVRPFHPIMTLEEPEAHLHPNAQKTLFRQLNENNSQVIVSTHSPYFVTMADLGYIRSLKFTQPGISASTLSSGISDAEKYKLAREVLTRRAEILFARAIILCEGITEEQVRPSMFEIHSGGSSLFGLGVSCVSVNGKNYQHYVKVAISYGIPVFIVSDNDGSTRSDVEAQIDKLRGEGVNISGETFGSSFCDTGNNFEREIVKVLQIQPEIKIALIRSQTAHLNNQQEIDAKTRDIMSLTDDQMIEKLQRSKSDYSKFLADVIVENPNLRQAHELVTAAVSGAFAQINEWLSR